MGQLATKDTTPLVLLTIGKNPLPCLVQSYRLARSLQQTYGYYPDFIAVCTSYEEANLIHEYLRMKLEEDDQNRIALGWSNVTLKDPGNPAEVYQRVKDALEKKDKRVCIHCAYTGGTAAMAVHTFEAASKRIADVEVHASYLDADTHIIRSRSEIDYYQHESGSLDERWFWKLDSASLAKLHGWTEKVGQAPSVEVVQVGIEFLKHVVLRRDEYYRWMKAWKKAFGAGDGRDVWIEQLREINWPKNDVPWEDPVKKIVGSPDWLEIGLKLKKVFGLDDVWIESAGGLSIRATWRNRKEIIPLFHFLDNQALELFVFAEVRKLLRPSFGVSHSVRFTSSTAKDFELDVVAVLGYQLIAISCTMSSNYKTCKVKAFEILHRARQIGGGQACAVLISMLSKQDVETLELDMKDEAANNRNSLRIFGRNELSDVTSSNPKLLYDGLHSYLDQLRAISFLRS